MPPALGLLPRLSLAAPSLHPQILEGQIIGSVQGAGDGAAYEAHRVHERRAGSRVRRSLSTSGPHTTRGLLVFLSWLVASAGSVGLHRDLPSAPRTGERSRPPVVMLRCPAVMLLRLCCRYRRCSPEELPSDYEPLRADECAVCRALVGDLFHVVHFSRERPTSAKNDNFFRLHALMAHACAELQMRHAIRPSEVGRVAEVCES